VTRPCGPALGKLGTWWVAAITCFVGACAQTPLETEMERLDSRTGTTVTVMPKPVELLTEGRSTARSDPFAYVAPFETNRMGTHELFLWVSAPQLAGALEPPQVFCGDQPVPLDTFQGTLADVGLSSPPYKQPAPWSVQWVFRLSGEVLDCFATAPRLRVITKAADEEQPATYVAQGEALSGLSAFVQKVRT